jgi:predicted alpha/beta hydrolase
MASVPHPRAGDVTSIVSRPVVIPCADGYVLKGTIFEPPTAPDLGATIVVCSAMLVREAYYARFSRDMAARGFRVLTCDNRGLGRSLKEQAPGFRLELRHWGELDLPATVAWAKGSAPDHRLFAVGHSMGGQLLDLSPALHSFDALVTVAATSAWWGHWPWPRSAGIRAWYAALSTVGRLLRTLPADIVGLGPNVDGNLVRDWARWGLDENYVRGPFDLRSEAAAYRGRVLAYSFADDKLGTRRAVEALHSGYASSALELRHVSPCDVGAPRIGHFGFFRGPAAPRLWQETAEWLACGGRLGLAAPDRGSG